MAHVVLLRGVNVGGHRTFRPTELVKKLAKLDVVNIGAAGTFVVHTKVTQAKLRTEIIRVLPFDAEIMIVTGAAIKRLVARDPFAGQPEAKDIMWFVSTLARAPRTEPALPMAVPNARKWDLRILEREGRFVLGMYRRHMKAVGNLGKIDDWFGQPATTRNWNTINAIAKALSP